MPSIVNGLFSGRSGISSHGIAIAVVGDNISNASTLGYKTSRAEFADLIAGGQTSGKVVGSGSQVSSISTIFEQGTSEFTGRPLDLTVDGNGFFVLGDEGGQKFYTRAGNFKLDESGNIVNQNGLNVLGFPAAGSGALEALNVNQVSQDSVNTRNVTIAGNLDASAGTLAGGVADIPLSDLVGSGAAVNGATFSDLSNTPAEYSTVVDVYDTLGAKHTLTLFFFHTDSNEYSVRAYVKSDDTDTPPGEARQVTTAGGDATTGTFTLAFNGDGTMTAASQATASKQMSIQFNNGSDPASFDLDLSNFTQYSANSNVGSIVQDGKGVGTVTSLSVENNGEIFAILSNGQTSIIGTVGLVNFANPEGLVRIGNQLLQQSPDSGEPIVGRPDSGTLGAIAAGTVELSTVDIANEFVKLITLQRGFQANSRIITTINQLLNDIIQLA